MAEEIIAEEIKGTNVAGAIVPFTTGDKFPTHYAKYGHGGYRTVESIDEMNSIPADRRENGMLVYVTEEDKIYKYDGTSFVVLNLGGGSEYTGGTNIDITDNTISAKGYTYDDNDNFSIGNETTYTEINDLVWEVVSEEQLPETQDIQYNGAAGDFSFTGIIKKGDFIRFFDKENNSGSIYQVLTVNDRYFIINGFWKILPDYTTVEKVVGGPTILSKNDGNVYIKNIGNYSGVLSETEGSVSSLQDVINMHSESIEELHGINNSNPEYIGGNNISIEEDGTISALGYTYDSETDTVTVPGELKLLSNEYESYIRMNYTDFVTNSIIFDFKKSAINLTDTPIISNTTIQTSGCMNAEQGFYERSDIRKKNVIDELPLDKAYELINNCQSIIYTLKDNTDKQQIGLIAQEVREFFPEIVEENKEGFLSLNYSRLTVVLLRVLKDLIDRVSKLESK